MIVSLPELIEYLRVHVPNFSAVSQHEYSSQSPLKVPGSWIGHDGFKWWLDSNRIFVWDRILRQGADLSQIWHQLPFDEPIEVDWKQLYETLSTYNLSGRVQRVYNLSDRHIVATLHANVERSYWYSYNLSDATIDQFRLGFGTLADPKYPHPRHVIPIPLYNDPTTYTFLTRKAIADDSIAHRMPKGAPPSLWFNRNLCREHSRLYYSEGGLATLAAHEMGFTPVFSATHGASVWDHRWTRSLLDLPQLEEIVFFQDNDRPGLNQIIRIMNSIEWKLRATQRTITFSYLRWDEDTPQAYDPADILKALGKEAGREWLYERIMPVDLADLDTKRNHNTYTTGLTKTLTPSLVSLETLRSADDNASIVAGIKNYLDNYDLHRGRVYINASAPGTGKNYALVEVLQERAKENDQRIQKRQLERQEAANLLEKQIGSMIEPDQIENAKKRLSRLRQPLRRKFAVVASPFTTSYNDMKKSHPNFDENLWMYFESRNPENCQNFVKAEHAAGLGYNVSQTVCRYCPFAQECQQTGYLSQMAAMNTKPILSIRHQHLRIENIAKAKEVYIDEYPGNSLFVNQKMDLEVNDIRLPQGWEEWLDFTTINAVNKFLNILRQLISEGSYKQRQATVLIGRAFFEKLQSICLENYQVTLEDILLAIDPEMLTHAATLSELPDQDEFSDDVWNIWNIKDVPALDIDSLPRRCIDTIFRVLLTELSVYLIDPADQPDWNSRISLCGNLLTVFPMEALGFSDRTKVVVLDATPIQPLYDKMFDGREVAVYAPMVKQNATKTTLLIGNGFGITELSKNLRKASKGVAVLSRNFDGHPNDYLRHAWNAIHKLTTLHKSLLVISHKLPIEYLKKQWALTGIVDTEVVFNNYGNVRGLNEFQHIESVLLIGTPRKSHLNIIQEYSAWFHRDKEPLAFEGKKLYTIPYHDRDDGFSIWSFMDDRAREVFMAEVSAELKQAAARVRPHTSENGKSVYMLGSFPALDWVTEVVEYREWIYGSKATLRLFAEEWLRQQTRIPGMGRFAKALRTAGHKIGEKAARQLYQELIKEL